MKLREFQHWYKSPAALGKRLVSIKDELSKRIEVEEIPSRARMKLWGFQRKAEEAEPKPEQTQGTDWVELAKATAQPGLLPPEQPKPEDELAIMEEFGGRRKFGGRRH
jgi:hypothetical protein